MTGMDTTPVEIPDEVVAAWCQGADVDWDMARDDLALIAEPVVVAELRRLAYDWASTPHAATGADAALRARADEIERARDGETP